MLVRREGKLTAIGDAADSSRSDVTMRSFIDAAGVRLAQTFAIVLVIGGVVATASYISINGSLPPGAAMPFALLGLSVLALQRRGHARLAILTLLWGMCLIPIMAAANYAGLQGLGLLALPIVMMSAGWLVGRAQAVALTVMAMVGVLVLYWMHATGVNFTNEQRFPIYAVAYLLLIVLGSAIGASTAHIVHSQYNRLVGLSEDLRNLNADLEARVEVRTHELSEALAHLQRTQDDLVQAEKLASLGSMVAGISHELNTPIGNAVTVVGALHARALALKASAKAGTMKRSELDSGLDTIAEMSTLIDRSVNRAATLVASFKQVAIDQTSERRRDFSLRELVEDMLTSLRPGFRHQPWVIVNAVPDDIRCDSFPGPLGQVLTNLIQNAVLHAFEGRDHGAIEICARRDAEAVVLDVVDDGIGMNTVTLVHIFEPFFTTKLGRGGSGMGLAICRRIANNVLAGDLTVRSAVESGTCFTLRMPIRTPGKL